MKKIMQKHEFEYDWDIVENEWIPLKDGSRLSARIFHPKTDKKLPAILEYIPYRKRDGMRGRDEPMHGFFAGHGYHVVRVDLRGCGESDGLLLDEYLKQEQDDALDVIEWISEQSWCDGNVGMMGKSWGGFNSLQVAARQPKALKAILCVGYTDDRYNEDIHYKGGCLLNDNFWWGAIMLGFQSRGIDPLIKPNSKQEWINRLENMPHFAYEWMKKPLRDDYWKHGSVCECYKDIKVPVFAIDGWSDSYTNTIFSLLQGLDKNLPKRGIIGPWAHVYAHDGYPAPAMDFLGEAVAWWDRWLKGKENGAEFGKNKEMISLYLEDGYKASAKRDESKGRWVGIGNVPSNDIKTNIYKIDDYSLYLLDANESEYKLPLSNATTSQNQEYSKNIFLVKSPVYHGLMCGEWMGAGVSGESPLDQRKDNALSTCFDSGILERDLEIVGYPVLNARIKSDKKSAMIYASICDVDEDAVSTRVSYGVYNLSHRDNHSSVKDATEWIDLKLKLDMCGYKIKKGHRLRLSLATSYWPMFWAMPEEFTLTVDKDNFSLEIPEFKGMDIIGPSMNARSAMLTPTTLLSDGKIERQINYDVLEDEVTYITNGVGGVFGEGIYRFDEPNIRVEHNLKRILKIKGDDPLSASYEIIQTMKNGREDWDMHADIVTTLNADKDFFYLGGEFIAYLNQEKVFSRKYDYKLERYGL